MTLPAALAITIALTDVTIVDTVNGRTLPARTVVVKDKRIAAITTKPPAGATVVNGRGKFLIPGLWDMHIHIRGGAEAAADNEALLKLYVANGVTSVREMGGDLTEKVLEWRKQINDGTKMGPRIFTSGPKLDGAKPTWPGSIPVTNPEEGRQAVIKVHQMGVDFVKLYFDYLELPTLRAITAEAKRLKLPVAGHNARNLTVREFGSSGVKDIQHSRYYVLPGGSVEETAIAKEYGQRRNTANPMTIDEWAGKMTHDYSEAQERSALALLAKNKVWVTPTILVGEAGNTIGARRWDNDPRRKYIPPQIWKSWDPAAGRRKALTDASRVLRGELQRKAVAQIPRLRDAGIGLLAGTDTGYSNNYVFPGFALHEEVSLLRDAGLTNAQALQTATINAARFFRLQKRYGSIGKGKAADLVLLDANPLVDVRNTTKIAGVMLHGEWLDRAALDKLLADVAALNK